MIINYWSSIGLLWQSLLLINFCLSQCPKKVSGPCQCAPSRHKKANVICDNAASFGTFQEALPPPETAIDYLIIANSHLPRLFAHAFNKYAVRRLVLRNNSMIDVDKLAFDSSPMVHTLNQLEISENLLESVPDLSRLRNLTSISLTFNQIQRIPAGFFLNFESKKNLITLDLSGNFLDKLDRDSFMDLENLKEINLDKNFFHDIPSQSLTRLSRLTSLSFNANQLKSISSDSLPLTNLRTLSLEANHLHNVQPDSFRYLKHLIHLYLGGNRLEFVDPELFRYTPNLQVLSLGNNPIKMININSFKFLPNLIRIDLPDCQIEEIQAGAFHITQKISVVDLSRNKLKRIAASMFQGLISLYSVNLKGNEINQIESASFASLPALRHVDLSSNNLSHLDPSCFSGSLERAVPETSKFLYIYDNPWACDSNLVPFINWIKTNFYLIIDAPGQLPSTCDSPPSLFGVHLKHSEISNVPLTLTPESMKHEEPNYSAKKQFGVILGILIVALLLLLLARYFISKQRRDRKLNEESFRMSPLGHGQFSRRNNSYHSSSHPVETGPMELDTGHELHKPWYHVLNFKV